MKLAEALSLRATLIQKANNLRNQLCASVKVQEGDEPDEQPDSIVDQLTATLSQLRDVIYRINITNAATIVDGHNLTYWLAERDTLNNRTRALKEALSTLNERPSRYSHNEVKYVRTVNVDDFRHLYDQSASALRKIDLKIQEAGWLTELIEE